ncbi:MAG: L-2-hydroxyglutarate oxidase [Solirubrobacterales bacterium]|nr:L-2-hydroxyglutarate oxidase [Solirubrobacterales bacterium]
MSSPDSTRPPAVPASCDLIVVGGGIIGLAVAREALVREPRASVVVLERERQLALHQSSHNSGVIHAGIYYKPGSLKAQLCVEGAAALYRLCAELGVPAEPIGKLIVATSAAELAGLEGLHERALANGVRVTQLSGDQLREIEPHANGVAALHSPDTGIVDYAAVCAALAADVLARGGEVITGCAVERVERSGDGARVIHSQGATACGGAIVCAGLQSDRLAQASGASADPRIVPFRGAYFTLRRPELVRGLIYPVPDPELPFLGVHMTRRIGGDVVVGPTALPAAARSGNSGWRVSQHDLISTLSWPGSYRMAWRWRRQAPRELAWALSSSAYAREASRLISGLTADDLEPSFAGLRAQAVGRDGALVDDFVFAGEGRVVHLRNAPSPAATASLAIAAHCCDRLGPITAAEPSARAAS